VSHPFFVKVADLIEGFLSRTPMRMTNEMLVLRDLPLVAWVQKLEAPFSSSLDAAATNGRPVGRPARLNCLSIACRKFCRR
jgi:hypothetical protein